MEFFKCLYLYIKNSKIQTHFVKYLPTYFNKILMFSLISLKIIPVYIFPSEIFVSEFYLQTENNCTRNNVCS